MKNERIEIHLTPEESQIITNIANEQGLYRKNYIENLCRKEIHKHSQTAKATDILKEIVEWWDEWNAADDPGTIVNPPIEEARDILKKLKKTAP